MNDKARAAIIAFIQSAVPVLVLFDIVKVTDVQIAGVMLTVNNGLTLLMLFWKSGQEGDVTPVTPVVNVPVAPNNPGNTNQ